MEKLYRIKDNYAEILIQEDIYPLITVKKAISNFMQEVYIKIDHIDNNIICIKLVLHNTEGDFEKIIGEFYNELLRESIRYNISKETKNLRELIVGRALYTTCIELDKNDKVESDNKEKIEENYNLDDIAVNWFLNNENEEV